MATSRALTLRGQTYPVVLPTLRDPRLHVASVIVTIHVLGQVGLHFQVSVPQILAAILATALIEMTVAFRQSRSIVWPASAMLTGSGVALILRVVGTPPDDPWNTASWYVFAGVATFALLTKYVLRYRGGPLLNPSNIGLVVAFLVLGNSRIEPLDFWWAPLNVWMIVAYIVIIGGGTLITRRLRLLAMAVTFWFTLAAGIGVLAASGHCMTTNWSFVPVCGFDFWRTIVTSPEVMIFLFFMITDPRSVPAGRVGRVVFALLVGIVSPLLMAPQTNEFGAKVGLLAGLVIVCAMRPVLDRFLPEPRSEADNLRGFLARLATGPGGRLSAPARVARVGAVTVAALAIGVALIAAGGPARGFVAPSTAERLDAVPHNVDSSTFPAITVDQGVLDIDHTVAGSGAQKILVVLAENLELENQALLRRDGNILTAVDHGDRLVEMQARLRDAETSGQAVVEHYHFDSVHVVLIVPFGMQTGASLGFESRGTVLEETYDAKGVLLSQRSTPFAATFAVRRATGARWLNVALLPLDGSH